MVDFYIFFSAGRRMEAGKFFIDWEDFRATSSERFRGQIGKREFSDVTLVSSDGKRVPSHQVILASGSSFFRRLLEEEETSKPLVFLRGVDFALLQPLLHFLYTGKAEIPEAKLEKFVGLAEELGVEGLEQSSENLKEASCNEIRPETNNQQTFSSEVEELKPNVTTQDLICSQCNSKFQDVEDLNKHIRKHVRQQKRLQKPTENIEVPEKGDDDLYHCQFCEKTITHRNNFRRHVKKNHLGTGQFKNKPSPIEIPEQGNDGEFQCQHCEKTIRHRSNFRRHMKQYHTMS